MPGMDQIQSLLAVLSLLLGFVNLDDNPYGVDANTVSAAIEALIRGASRPICLYFWGEALLTVQGVKSGVYLPAIGNSAVHATLIFAAVYWIWHFRVTKAQRLRAWEVLGDSGPDAVLDNSVLSIAGDDSLVGLHLIFIGVVN